MRTVVAYGEDRLAVPVFVCDRQAMTLTRRGCARLWESANDHDNPPHPWEGRAKCLNCRIGAGHAGRTIDPQAALKTALERICPRCTKISDRIINTRDGHRLCVSCANRHYEAFRRRRDGGIGCNAKGRRPQICGALHPERAVIIAGPDVKQMVRPSCLSPLELMLAAVRTASGAFMVGKAPNDSVGDDGALLQKVPVAHSDAVGISVQMQHLHSRGF